MPSRMTAERVEERWTATTIQTAFVFHSLPNSNLNRGPIIINLPLLDLGWTFTLSLTPQAGQPHKERSNPKYSTKHNWVPTAFSFRLHWRVFDWGLTSIHAQLSLGEDCPPHDNTGDTGINSTLLGAMDFIQLAWDPAYEQPLATPCIISLLQHNKVWLSVTISGCPFSNGLFEVRSVTEAEVQAQLVRQSCDRLLSRSLANGFTGKLFNVKFLAFSTRSTSGNTGEPLPTYASLCVLEKHVNLSESSTLKEGWTNALAALDNPGTKHVGEILCPKDYEYEQDSDFDDENEISSSDCQQSLADSDTERSSNSLTSLEMEGASDKGSVGYRPEEIIRGPNELSSDYERTVWVKFAAHRTWHAFLWYCYTGNLQFGKLRSQVEPGGQHLCMTSLDGEAPTCSPKSMYRLADLIGDEDLKDKALVAIKEKMTAENVLDDSPSSHPSMNRYPKVREVQLGILRNLRRSPKVKEAFLRAIEKYSSMPHAKPVLSALYDNLVA